MNDSQNIQLNEELVAYMRHIVVGRFDDDSSQVDDLLAEINMACEQYTIDDIVLALSAALSTALNMKEHVEWANRMNVWPT